MADLLTMPLPSPVELTHVQVLTWVSGVSAGGEGRRQKRKETSETPLH